MALSTDPRLVLASTSRYRRSLLDRFGVPYSAIPPGIDEGIRPNEAPTDLVHRLSREKAQAVAARHPNSIIVGSDQAAVRDREILGKPGTVERCFDQLRAASGRSVQFHTGVCVLDTRNGNIDAHVDITTVKFRALTDDEIRRYIEKDQPLDCAGGFKVESLGIALLERVDSQDPTALIGLPLIWLGNALRRRGLALP
jgi:septum formation protein